MKEIYKTIPFEDNYEVSNKGNVRTIETGLVRRLNHNRYGYATVTLYPSWKKYTVHQLVARTWLWDTYKEGLQVDHLNAIRDDNNVENLEWVTPEENVARIKVKASHKGEINAMSSITDRQAYLIKYTFSKTISEMAEMFETTVGVVETIRRRERWLHIIDNPLERLFELGELKYAKGATANLSKEEGILLNEDLSKGILSTKELMSKYDCSKSTVCYRRRNLGL